MRFQLNSLVENWKKRLSKIALAFCQALEIKAHNLTICIQKIVRTCKCLVLRTWQVLAISDSYLNSVLCCHEGKGDANTSGLWSDGRSLGSEKIRAAIQGLQLPSGKLLSVSRFTILSSFFQSFYSLSLFDRQDCCFLNGTQVLETFKSKASPNFWSCFCDWCV